EWPYYQNKHTHCNIGGITPAPLSNDDTKRLWKLTDAITSKMIDHGFNNQFLHCEFFMIDGDFKLVEVNGRIDPSLPPVYNIVYENGDSWQALLHLGSGKKVTAPKHNGMLGMCGYIQTFAADIAENLLDFDEVAKHPIMMRTLCSPKEMVEQTSDIYATALAETCLTGYTVDDLIKRHHELCKRVLKKPDLTPWE
ncbi:uncharacterized protein LOC102804887, partial [Saccoglossus kowalevskii]